MSRDDFSLHDNMISTIVPDIFNGGRAGIQGLIDLMKKYPDLVITKIEDLEEEGDNGIYSVLMERREDPPYKPTTINYIISEENWPKTIVNETTIDLEDYIADTPF